MYVLFQGDYGRPLIISNPWYYGNTLVGIYNFGIKFGDPNFPDIYIKMSAVCDWIVIKAGLYKIYFNINWIKTILGYPDNATDIKRNLSK